jgi:hypothetical protein
MQELAMNEGWIAVIGRSLAQISMHMAEVDNKTISERAAFLENLGLERKEIAIMLGSTTASISELLRQKTKKEETNAKNKKVRK